MTSASNIPKLYLIKASKWFMLYMPYVVPFYESNGLGMKELMLLQAVYSVTIVGMEIPSGYAADVLGRKKTMVLGTILGFTGFILYSAGHGFWGFLVAEVVLGLAFSFISGADSAILYDSLLERGREKEYIRYEGRVTSIGNISEASAAFLAFIPAAISLRTPYVAQTFIAFLAIPAAFLLREPAVHGDKVKPGWKQILGVVRYSLYENIELRRNIFFSSVIGAATLTMAWFAQRFFGTAGLRTEYYSPVWAILNLAVGLVALAAYRIEKKAGMNLSLVLISLLVPMGYLGMSMTSSLYGLIIIFLFYLVRGYATPVLKDYINRLTPSNVRATVLSVRNFIIRLIFAVTAPFFGWIADAWSIQQAFLLSGLFFLFAGGITLVLYLKSARGFRPR